MRILYFVQPMEKASYYVSSRLGSKSIIGELCHWSAAGGHRESYGGAGPGVVQPVLRVPVARGRWLPRIQCRKEQRSIIKRSGERRRVQYILYLVTQVNRGRGKFGKGDGQSTTFLRLVFKSNWLMANACSRSRFSSPYKLHYH